MNAPQPREPRRPPSVWRTVRAVAWSLFGVRRGSEYQQDGERITPLHVIAVGLAAIFVLVLGLIALVKLVV
ncbi:MULTISPECIES: DUF2970 domain-containing protein [Delftia]|jgi:hypothetical protein|uniref:DUF2970 domain-containing protein n=1 Tax=Delftia acidovorans TaxID=80866 RepID=A0AAJ2R299_DELAC|nr:MULTISPECIES: DUF2970 domain-containing protein [Delftia]PIF39481.1 Protein of unknown function (DUF2970) [Burkholderiales bacterium 23]AEF91871.1 putative transmembrane protein [Delftia sp. Cs1-4]APE47839.1 hypothetical protein BO996_08200 [Delftia sp. HK171]ATH13864.1 DUF2970 domain-containing protein [Delftia acidovorans]EZP50068.1 putative transmembrane protein [Delftia sp. RIT313]